ncbi:MAG: GNAT family N-acetyltransferase [Thermonemataceae bacterium]
MEIFPQLTTERLCLNALQVKDIPAIVTYAADVRITQYTLNIPTPYAEKDAVYWLNMAQEGFKEGTHFIFANRKKAQQE